MCNVCIKEDDNDDDGDDDDDDYHTLLKYEAVLKFMQTLKAPSILETSKTRQSEVQSEIK